MQLEAYLRGDDRIVLPVGSTEQHAYLSLETDNILAERASVEAAEPLGVPVLPVLPYGVNGFAAYPGSPTLRESTLVALLSDVVDSLVGQGFGSVPVRWGQPAHDCAVFIPQGSTIAELHEVVELARTGGLTVEVEQFGFEETPLAYDRLRAGTLNGRAVVVLDT